MTEKNYFYISIAQFKKNGQVIGCSFGHQQHLSLLPAFNAVAPLPAVIIVDLLEFNVCSLPRVFTRQTNVEAGVVPPASGVLISAIHLLAVIVVTVPGQRGEECLRFLTFFGVSYLVLNLIPSRL